ESLGPRRGWEAEHQVRDAGGAAGLTNVRVVVAHARVRGPGDLKPSHVPMQRNRLARTLSAGHEVDLERVGLRVGSDALPAVEGQQDDGVLSGGDVRRDDQVSVRTLVAVVGAQILVVDEDLDLVQNLSHAAERDLTRVTG